MMKFRISDCGLRIVGVIATLLCGLEARSQQCYIDPLTGQKVCGQPAYGWAVTNPQSEIRNPQSINSPAHCRITVGDGSAGSGTLVARTQSGGLILTCSHLFDGSTANIEAAFANGLRFAARLVERDRVHDLAALVIRRPDIEPVEVSAENSQSLAASRPLSACGFGPAGQFRCLRGPILGFATPVGAAFPSLTIRGAVRPGDSGGAVLGDDGKLVGVVWGQRDGVTYATCGRPLRDLLERVLGRGFSGGNRIAIGEVKPPANLNDPSTAPMAPPAGPPFDWQSWTSQIDARLRALDAAKQEKGDYLRRGEVPDWSQYAKRDELAGGLENISGRFESVLGRVQQVHERIEQVAEQGGGFFQGLSLGKLLVGALGLSGPLAIAVIAAGGLFSWRVRKRVASGHKQPEPARAIPVDSPPLPQHSVTETHYVPYELDSFARAHQWASEQIARKYPGAAEILQAQGSLIKQHMSAH
jgi:hypothetical protein